MKNKRKRSRQAAEARLMLNDWEACGVRMLRHRAHGVIEVRLSGKITHHPKLLTTIFGASPLPKRRGDDFWLAANYVFKKGWA